MKLIGIYPGNFQPPHRGHWLAYQKLKKVVGMDIFVATTDRTPTPDAPLNFGEKENIWVRHGVPINQMVKVKNWEQPKEIFKKFSENHTSAIFSLNSRELDQLHVRNHYVVEDKVNEWKTTENTLGYFQPYKGNEHNLKPFNQHGYVKIEEDNIIDGKVVSTANIRLVLGAPRYTDDQKKKFFEWAFGWFDIGLFQELVDKFKLAQKSYSADTTPVSITSVNSLAGLEPVSQGNVISPHIQNKVREMVREIMMELMSPPPTSTPQGTETTNGLPGEKERSDNEAKNRISAVQAKRSAERDLKTLDSDLKWKKASVEKLRRDDLPNKRKEIDAINKSVSSGEPPPLSSGGY